MDSNQSINIEDEWQDLPPINFREDIGLSDQDLVKLSTKDLNRLLKKKNIAKERQKQIKQERRTLKNRGYAANCRVKREDEEKILEQMNEDLKLKIWSKTNEIRILEKENEKLFDAFRRLETDIQELREEEGKSINDEAIKALLRNKTEIDWKKEKEWYDLLINKCLITIYE